MIINAVKQLIIESFFFKNLQNQHVLSAFDIQQNPYAKLLNMFVSSDSRFYSNRKLRLLFQQPQDKAAFCILNILNMFEGTGTFQVYRYIEKYQILENYSLKSVSLTAEVFLEIGVYAATPTWLDLPFVGRRVNTIKLRSFGARMVNKTLYRADRKVTSDWQKYIWLANEKCRWE